MTGAVQLSGAREFSLLNALKRHVVGFAVITALFIHFFCAESIAAHFTVEKYEKEDIKYEKILVSGPIEAGDAEKFERAAKNGLESQAFIIASLNSSGGEYREGLKLAEYFLSNDIATVVEDGANCLSACAIAFLGGVRTIEEGNVYPARSISSRARLGFHAPFLNVERRSPSEDEIGRAYDKAVKTITDFIRISGRLNIIPEAAADMMTPQREQLYYIETMRDALYVDLEIQGIEPPKALTESMAVNLCINSIVEFGEDDAAARTELRDVADDTGWSASQSTREIRSDRFGENIKIRRTLVPAYYDGEGSGYFFCVIDHALVDGELKADCRGLALLDIESQGYFTLFKNIENAEGKGNSNAWQPDADCIPTGLTVEPLSEHRGIENRWALAPKSTPISELSNVLERYAKSEKPL